MEANKNKIADDPAPLAFIFIVFMYFGVVFWIVGAGQPDFKSGKSAFSPEYHYIAEISPASDCTPRGIHYTSGHHYLNWSTLQSLCSVVSEVAPVSNFVLRIEFGPTIDYKESPYVRLVLLDKNKPIIYATGEADYSEDVDDHLLLAFGNMAHNI